MDPLDRQTEYWDRVAEEKEFLHPLDAGVLRSLVPETARLLDFGCGYGRTCADLAALGYENVVGVDVSQGMIARGRRLHPGADLRLLEGDGLPLAAGSFDAVLLFAVLTCVPTDDGQRALVAEIARVLRTGGILYVSDFLLQDDPRNQVRYAEFAAQYGKFGVFRLPEGVVVRHHSMDWIDELLSPFRRVAFGAVDVTTMNGNASKAFQYFGRKP